MKPATLRQLIYVICVGLPDVPHAVITIAYVLLIYVGFLPAIPTPVIDYTIARNVLGSPKQLSQTMMPVFCDEGVFHTVADILSQTHVW